MPGCKGCAVPAGGAAGAAAGRHRTKDAGPTALQTREGL